MLDLAALVAQHFQRADAGHVERAIRAPAGAFGTFAGHFGERFDARCGLRESCASAERDQRRADDMSGAFHGQTASLALMAMRQPNLIAADSSG